MTQDELVLKHLRESGSITPLEALQLYGCFRLSARIYSLRSRGYDIETDYVTRDGKIYASYRFKNPRPNALLA